uniref:glucuronosyltransferase n=1 Tax=Catagonus wagneri TaxID=51154 RepID=A0A8C3VR90_9CETA
MSVKWLSLLLLLQLTCYFGSGRCGKVLVLPMEYSHWINMKIILEELVTKGHEVTVLKSSAAILIDPNKLCTIKFETFPASISQEDFENFLKYLIKKWIQAAKHSFWTHTSTTQNIFSEVLDVFLKTCKEAVSNKRLMTKLRESRFDVVLADAVVPCSELLAEMLNIPLVYSLRFSPGYAIEKFGGKLPLPPSYVPVVMSELKDHMTFMERVKNMMYTLYFDFYFQIYDKKWDRFYTEALGKPTTLFVTMGKAYMWLIRNYWDFEFPRPLLPNFEFIGGFHCKPAKPLPKVTYFCLLHFFYSETNKIDKPLVLWRYDGKIPDTLGSNTRLYKWIPQNDLLGKTRKNKY